MTDIQVSLFGSATRTHCWSKFFEQFTMNKVKYEIIFAGPVKPDFELPSNVSFIHIDPDTGPVHCSSAASKMCVGETIMLIADDTILTPYALDIMYAKYKEENDYKCMIHPRYGFGPESDVTEVNEETHLPGSTYRIGINLLWSRKFFFELGGYDNRYSGGAGDCDMQMRALSQGGRHVYAYGAFAQEDLSYVDNDTFSLLRAWQRWRGREDNIFMKQQWYPSGSLLNEPTTPFEPIE